jgi:hypothetical protein
LHKFVVSKVRLRYLLKTFYVSALCHPMQVYKQHETAAHIQPTLLLRWHI